MARCTAAPVARLAISAPNGWHLRFPLLPSRSAGNARGSEILRAAGAYDVWYEAPIPEGGRHLMGTARMGTDPERSVVNEWGRSHDVKNLFIVDGSIFVTSAGVNPTRTIQALALYVADSIKQRLAAATLFD